MFGDFSIARLRAGIEPDAVRYCPAACRDGAIYLSIPGGIIRGFRQNDAKLGENLVLLIMSERRFVCKPCQAASKLSKLLSPFGDIFNNLYKFIKPWMS